MYRAGGSFGTCGGRGEGGGRGGGREAGVGSGGRESSQVYSAGGTTPPSARGGWRCESVHASDGQHAAEEPTPPSAVGGSGVCVCVCV